MGCGIPVRSDPLTAIIQSLAGLLVIPLIALTLSEDRKVYSASGLLRMLAVAIGLQLSIAGLFILIPQSKIVFDLLVSAVAALQAATGEGMKFLFGYLAGGDAPFQVKDPSKSFVLALQALPLVLIMSALSALLYHWGILQRVVGFFAWCLQRTMGVTGPVGTASAANIFVGMVEAPLFVRPYIRRMSRGELFAMMTTGMATVAGTVMALYAFFLEKSIPGAAGHILVASIMSAPAALLIARIMVPWSDDAGGIAGEATAHPVEAPAANAMDAIARGTADGVRLLVSIAAMLVVMVALVALANTALGAITEPLGARLTVERLAGWAMAPLAFVIGIPWSEAVAAGELFGIKTVLNELLAYLKLASTDAGADSGSLSPRSKLIMLYALCGFANFGSLGIMLGGLIAMAPERKADILSLGLKTIVSGTLATAMTGAVIGVITPP